MIATKLEAVAKIANASAISRKLAATFDRSIETSTQRGISRRTAGFQVTSWPAGVLVIWSIGHDQRGFSWPKIKEIKNQKTAELAEALTAAGYKTETIDGIGVAIRTKEQTDAN
jgi:hypothetical protein